MKKLVVSGIVVVAVGVLAPRKTLAQGTLYLSGLSQAPNGTYAVGSNSWLAGGFYTGYNPGGYMLNSVQLSMTNASGNPSGFTVMLYDLMTTPPYGPFPGSSLGTLTGSTDPATAGTYTYTAPSGLMLSENTLYFIVLTGGTSVTNGAYEIGYTDSTFDQTGNWQATVDQESSNGSYPWSPLPNYPAVDPFQFALDASPVPEPSSEILLGLGGVGLIWLHRRAKTV